MSEGKQGPFIATINAVLVDGGHDDITAIAIVENEEDGELWFNANKPDDGTQVDYVLHDIERVFAASALLAALEEIANAETTCCNRCEGNGRLYADGKAHYTHEEAATILCGNCGGSGRLLPDDLQEIAQAAIEQTEKGE